MSEIIQGILEDMVKDLLDLKSREIFSEEEVSSIIDKRRNFEYKLMKKKPLKKDFLSAIQYEISLEEQRKSRKDSLNLKPSSSDRCIIRRILSLFKRFFRIFKHDIEVCKEYINFCIRSNSMRDLSQIMAHALQLHSSKEELWMIARYIEEKIKKDIDAARSVMQQSVVVNRKSEKLWIEYFNFELENSKNTDVPVIVFKYALEELPGLGEKMLKISKSKVSDENLLEMKKIVENLR